MSVQVKLSSSADENVTFEEPFLILVEGGDDQAVVAAMVRHEKLENFRVHNMFGKASWTARAAVIAKAPEFVTNVKAMGLVRDSDNDPNAAWDSCVSALKACSFPVPAKSALSASGQRSAAILIVPARDEQGAIEELCAKSFDPDRLACVDSYYACLGAAGVSPNSSKGRSQAYLAGLRSAPRDLAVAASRGLLDMTHESFDELRAFVHSLATSAPGHES
ncbi:MAG TPA: DUF3226 domain-containing protein [Streptosporangiaceae bacterium]|nr:DUF3226 domain-containing protein [Streptosporangiaceae bacterium]